MADLNHVTLIGRLTRDAELKYTPGGLAISSFSIAVNRRRKNGDQWVDEVSYFDINLYGKPAESLKQYLTKGKQVAVDGELRQDRWEKDGQNHSRIYIAANNVQLLGGNTGSSNYSNAGGFSPANNNSQGYNQGYSQPQNSYQPRYDAPQDQYDPGSSYGSDSSFPEDIPF
ncbi:MAG: single-stranded DNA-binding protein [Treponemataceae bacterium]|jgi:single-strand DNA-binding protein|nr:single-stranded DNA-binding protein [Spirochaetaceae bacterium]MEE0878687.1 single-stranded DNA-binding protein [Treponemataceae bacterium]